MIILAYMFALHLYIPFHGNISCFEIVVSKRGQKMRKRRCDETKGNST